MVHQVVSKISNENASFNGVKIIQPAKSLTTAQICKTSVVSSTLDATNQGTH